MDPVRNDGHSKRRPTMDDVAAAAGVSRSLVSLVIRNSSRVSDKRRIAVERAIEELGYRPSAVAQSLAQHRTSFVGVMVSDLHDLFYADVVDGIQEEANRLGYRVLIGSGNRVSLKEGRVIESFLELRVGSLILLGPSVDSSTLALAHAELPVVVVGSRPPIDDVEYVVSDDTAGMRMAVAHLVELGHQRIAHISGTGLSGREREAAYRQVMDEVALGGEATVVPGDFSEQGGYEGMSRLLSQTGRRRPTAVLAPDDQAAVGALNALEAAGVSVPDQMSLIGYDNSFLAGLAAISLTTLEQPRFEMGVAAMRSAAERMEGSRRTLQYIVLNPVFVQRRTTARPNVAA